MEIKIFESIIKILAIMQYYLSSKDGKQNNLTINQQILTHLTTKQKFVTLGNVTMYPTYNFRKN